ncbi:energy-coupling factor transporter transmembrane component T [Neobacillus sp. OS1-32]|uniref:energy-coupling factor transporter transmembrane component T family protein n=1 Tax=Neobacillus sp. OS1-32 TaxID=3070682 RepID=UPI0027E0F515|nr:energy-coupling factor transporter transmembrane component T [Neobacillus sp. OS1-32]WML29810.1 energy-coupling factor transporter transmembrane component T [Neobacillus sp. OS1-32]
MPDWLVKNEPYSPSPDKDQFINKSILSILRILSKLKSQSGYQMDKFQVNAALKVAFTFLLVILLSLSTSYTFILVVDVYLLVVLSLMEGKEIVKILSVSLAMAIFTFMILLPNVVLGNSYTSMMITLKVLSTLIAVNILSHSTRWHSITSALRRFGVPNIFILVLDITIKYISMLGDFSLNMLYSLKLRSVGRNNNKYASMAGISGTMFIKSKEMAEDMYTAMECRGFTGEYTVHNKWKWSMADLLYILKTVAIITAFLYWGRI